MKKVFSLVISFGVMATLLVGCGVKENKKDEAKPSTKIEEKKTDNNQNEINEKLKKEAIKADFKKINGHEKESKSLKVFAKGKVSNIDNTEKIEMFKCFTITTEESEGAGMYTVYNIADVELKEGEIVTVYGSIDESKSKTGMPIIIGTLLEK